MNMYQISEQDLAQLEAYLQEIPFKYATNIINLFNKTLKKVEDIEQIKLPAEKI